MIIEFIAIQPSAAKGNLSYNSKFTNRMQVKKQRAARGRRKQHILSSAGGQRSFRKNVRMTRLLDAVMGRV